MSTLGDTFRGRSVLVTGHTGFKGSWLVAWLKRMGARVTGYALPAPPESETPSLFRAARLHEGITHVEGDLRDRAALSACVASAAPEVVLHLAAQSLVRHSYEEPVETFATNVLGTVHLLEACRPRPASSGGAWAGPRAVVVVTTDKCYENREWPWAYREVDALGGHDPYSASKACAELATAAYRGSFFGGANPVTRIASARAGNVIGGGDWAKDRILPDIVRATLAGTRARIRNPAAVRPWQHVLEPLAGYLLLAARLMEEGGASHARAWNFGPKDDGPVPVSVRGEVVTGRDGLRLGFIFVLTDLRDARRAAQVRERLEAALRQAARVAQPQADDVVTAILANASLAAMDIADATGGPPVAGLLDEVEASTRRAAALYAQIRNFMS